MKKFLPFIAVLMLLPIVTLAGDTYIPLAKLPILKYDELSIEAYINALYLLSISVAAILAVLKITLAGVKYVMSDIVTQKGDAKKDIQGALFGLLIVMAAFIILNTINRDLTAFATLSGVSNVVRTNVNPEVEATKAATAQRQAKAGADLELTAQDESELNKSIVACRKKQQGYKVFTIKTGEPPNTKTIRSVECVDRTKTDSTAVINGDCDSEDEEPGIECFKKDGDFTVDNSKLDGVSEVEVPSGSGGGGGGGGGITPTCQPYRLSRFESVCLPRNNCEYRLTDDCIDITDSQKSCLCVPI